MKTLTIVLIGLLIIGSIFVVYDFDNNENIKRTFNKIMGRDCELKTYSDGWTQIENCAVYRVKDKNKVGGVRLS